jgi:hypothetical protein
MTRGIRTPEIAGETSSTSVRHCLLLGLSAGSDLCKNPRAAKMQDVTSKLCACVPVGNSGASLPNDIISFLSRFGDWPLPMGPKVNSWGEEERKTINAEKVGGGALAYQTRKEHILIH